MKIVTFTTPLFEKSKYGVVTQSHITLPSLSFFETYRTLRDVIEKGALSDLETETKNSESIVNLADATLLPPIPNARRVICAGMNYPKIYPVKGAVTPPKNLLLFAKLEGTLVGHNTPLELPMGKAADTFDYEGEIVLIIGKAGRNIKKEDVSDHIEGYTVMNDGSVRDWQVQSLHAGKNFANSGSCGPWMVTKDEIDDSDELHIKTWLNGKLMQSAKAKDMLTPIDELVSYISHTIDLKPGDLIATGSPDGSGGSLTPPRFLVIGDEIEIEVSSIGTLKNTVGSIFS